MRLNKPANHMENLTHEGGAAFSNLTPIQELRRSVLACLLWEDAFYENGLAIADRIEDLAKRVSAEDLAALAVEARHDFGLRHAPLLLLEALTITGAKRKDGLVKRTIAEVVSGRADEPPEFFTTYWRKGRHPLSSQLKKGVADAIRSFDAYELAKYNSNYDDNAVKLRDVILMVHPKPLNAEQAALWQKIIKRKMDVADTWETALSAGADKRATFERLLRDKKLGYLALLRNLRKMGEVGVDLELIKDALLARRGAHKVFPFRFVAAARAALQFEPWIDEAMLAQFANARKLPGRTVIVVDVSGSMYGKPVSEKSDMDRAVAACALGAIARELCEYPLVFATAGNDHTCVHQTAQVPARRGMALVDAIYAQRMPLGGGGIFLRQVCDYLRPIVTACGPVDRTIVVTDEVDCDRHNKAVANPIGKGYLINVSTYKHGIGYGPWTHIDGFSEQVFRYILESEAKFEAKYPDWPQRYGQVPQQ